MILWLIKEMMLNWLHVFMIDQGNDVKWLHDLMIVHGKDVKRLHDFMIDQGKDVKWFLWFYDWSWKEC